MTEKSGKDCGTLHLTVSIRLDLATKEPKETKSKETLDPEIYKAAIFFEGTYPPVQASLDEDIQSYIRDIADTDRRFSGDPDKREYFIGKSSKQELEYDPAIWKEIEICFPKAPGKRLEWNAEGYSINTELCVESLSGRVRTFWYRHMDRALTFNCGGFNSEVQLLQTN